jgi:hypothetical protein
MFARRRWISHQPGAFKGAIRGLFAPTRTLFDQSWPLLDFEKVN